MKVSASKTGGGRKSPTYPKGEYKCPKCSNRIVVFVNMTMPPACGKHTGGLVAMDKIG